MRSTLRFLAAAVLTAFAVSSPAAASTILEIGDAGDLPGTAQIASGSGNLAQIDGSLTTGGDVDLFQFYIADPLNFSASTVGGANWDTQLFLFDSQGFGVSFKDDDGPLQSTLTGTFVPSAGLYYLAISRYDNDPLDILNQAIWLDTPFAVERAPDGPGASGALASWSPPGGPAGSYSIFFTGAELVGTTPVPEPATLLLLGTGIGAVAARRRLKKRSA